MLKSLKIQNFILIQETTIYFKDNLNVITGETGAGKSLLLGALKLVLGDRADKKRFKNQDKKCVIEAVFEEEINADLKDIFRQSEIPVERETIVRREISADGRSRSFINDSLVNLITLKQIASQWIDIHHQHESLEISDEKFRTSLIDHYGGHMAVYEKYRQSYHTYKLLEKEYAELMAEHEKDNAEFDYLNFQYEELSVINWDEMTHHDPEERLKTLTHSEEISGEIENSMNVLQHHPNNVLENLRTAIASIKKAQKYQPTLENILQRLEQTEIELNDVVGELLNESSKVTFDPKEFEELQQTMSHLFDLQMKHKVKSLSALKEKKEEIEAVLAKHQNIHELVKQKRNALSQVEKQLKEQARLLLDCRKKTATALEQHIGEMLGSVSLPNSKFIIEIEEKETAQWNHYGSSKIFFKFSANPGIPVEDVSKIASGGEISRLMLCLKSLLAKKSSLPTLIFDEIDTGISGETAIKVGKMMTELSAHIQMIAITHLPQIAAGGNQHIVIHKQVEHNRTETTINELNEEETVLELARMMGGDAPSESVFEAARELRNKN